MEFSLGFLKNDKQFLIREFGKSELDAGKIIGIEDIEKFHLQGLIYNESEISDENRAVLDGEIKFYPIRKGEDLKITYDQFTDLNQEHANNIYSKINDSWLLTNNINFLEELFKVVAHLKSLWPNDRTSFFEELWFVIRNNIGSTDLKIIYNDLEVGQKERDKNKLVRGVVSGERSPIPAPASEAEASVMENYEKDFLSFFDVSEYHPQKGEIIMTSKINNSPVLIMAKVNRFSRLQKALLNALFEGLQSPTF